MIKPNPYNCSTCLFAVYGEKVFCQAPTPLFVDKTIPRVVEDPTPRCDAHKAQKGTFKRICLNCGNPIRTHHKYTQLGEGQWIHKYCKHPESQSQYHHEVYCKAQGKDPT